ncbi:MAG TPA: exodeoxyribonuclease III [Porticoccaceae bacterium]|jgi:exodeoxyribonuclease-3|nr:exodeoxyribonuclease III [Porticoccaceae bacterium]
MPSKLKIMCFNVNGIRARLHQLEKVIDEHKPDILGLQEIKVSDDQFPTETIADLGYEVEFFGQKGHYGVALLSKTTAVKVQRGFPSDEPDAQRRMIHGQYLINGTTVHVINGYFPQGESRKHPTKFPAKKKYYSDLTDYVQNYFSKKEKLIVMGDMNVAAADIDIGIAPENAKRWLQRGICCFLPEERQWLDTLIKTGLVDTFRSMHPEDNTTYSWFDYRSKGYEQEPKRGLRIDLILANQNMAEILTDTGIDLNARASEKPSDHCPIWANFKL